MPRLPRLRALAVTITLALCALTGCMHTDRLSCPFCGAERLEVDEMGHDHGVGDCVYIPPCRQPGHYLMENDGPEAHSQCTRCGEWLCQGSHGEGRCQPPPTPEPAPSPTNAPIPTPTPQPSPSPIPGEGSPIVTPEAVTPIVTPEAVTPIVTPGAVSPIATPGE